MIELVFQGVPEIIVGPNVLKTPLMLILIKTQINC